MLASCLRGQGVMLRWILLALLIGFCAGAAEQKQKVALSRGWGNGIAWVPTYEEGLNKMVKVKKPLMVIHHLDNCPHSQELKKAFSKNKSIQKMAKDDFIMVNIVEETQDKNLAPDGYYVPRILFVDPTRTVRADIVGLHDGTYYAYVPEDMEHLIKNMKKAKELLKEPKNEL